MKKLVINQSHTKKDSLSLGKYFNEVAKTRLMSSEEEFEVFEKVKQGSQEAREYFITANLRFVISVAKQYQNRGLALPDLINEGNLGLLKAVDRYDPSRGFKFISYAVWWIRQSILQGLSDKSRPIRIPSHKVELMGQIKSTYSALEQKFQRAPLYKEIAKELNIDEQTVSESFRLMEDLPSLDETFGDASMQTLGNFVEESSSSDFEMQERAKEVRKKMTVLSPKEIRVIHMYYGIDDAPKKSLKDIGFELNLSQERIRQIKEGALRKLKKSLVHVA